MGKRGEMQTMNIFFALAMTAALVTQEPASIAGAQEPISIGGRRQLVLGLRDVDLHAFRFAERGGI